MIIDNYDTNRENKDSILFKLKDTKSKKEQNDNSLYVNKEQSKLIKEEIVDLGIVQDILMKLKDIKMETKKQFILNTINTALKDIFQKDVSIDIKTTSVISAGNKLVSKYDIILLQNQKEVAKNEKILKNNGGGVLSVISILFKMIVGYIYSDNKFYLFDEALSMVSVEYIPRLSKFLRMFCKKHNFTLVVVSHSEDITEEADLIYKLDAHFDKTEWPVIDIVDTIGHYPTSNYYYTKIKNFQSLVSNEFRFKGFVVIKGKSDIGKKVLKFQLNLVLSMMKNYIMMKTKIQM